MPWPDFVPILDEDSIAKVGMAPPPVIGFPPHEDRRCAWLWLCLLFGIDSPAYDRAFRMLNNKLIDDAQWRDPDVVGPVTALVLWNEFSPRVRVAKILNELFAELGYTEPYEFPSQESYLQALKKL